MLVERLRQELDQCKHFFSSREDEYRELLTHKDEEIMRLRSLVVTARDDPSRTRKADDDFAFEFLGRRGVFNKETQEGDRTRKGGELDLKVLGKELKGHRYGDS